MAVAGDESIQAGRVTELGQPLRRPQQPGQPALLVLVSEERQELLHLKIVWDHADLVESTFAAWRATLWPAVDLDAMLTSATKLQKDIQQVTKGQAKQARAWDVYLGMTRSLSDMLVALPLVQDLRDEAMRERHWKKLMRVCGRTFVMDAKFCLNDLCKLSIHLFADAVGDITEQARQEMKIDKQIDKIDRTWAR